MVNNFDAKTKNSTGVASPAWTQYEEEYKEEIQLNEAFHKFSTNFQWAYQGPNTAQAQIGAKYSTRKSVCIHIRMYLTWRQINMAHLYMWK